MTRSWTGDTTIEHVESPRPARQRLLLHVLYTPVAGIAPREPLVLARGETPVGRGVGPRGLSLPDDPRLSRLHATLDVDPAGVVRVTDQSRNGTFVEGRRVQSAIVAEGDILRVGDTFLVVRAEPEATPDADLPTILGRAPSIRLLRALVARIGPSDASVLVTGESGTGKELVAHALHETSGRAGPFVAVNCSALPETLAESHLFGHVAGAFTGAVRDHVGHFRSAHGGTLFLDEVGELPTTLQPKLLRVLEERVVLPVGAVTPVRCDVRIVAATNRELRRAVADGQFRGDLYARLADVELRTPPLRDRVEDVLPLFARALGPEPAELAPALVEALLAHTWPFNVRELVKIAREARLRAAGDPKLGLDLVQERFVVPDASPPASVGVAPSSPPPAGSRAQEVEAFTPDRDALVALLSAHGGNVNAVARATGRSRRQVYRWLEAHGIDLAEARGAR
ncbi:MAG: sigma 54-interacting transcriptional regulator [Deltaproteobacteria bacterium]|nr:sigma 54-interacting transcriptional regulator [Deltaproteobacteria bacterium]